MVTTTAVLSAADIAAAGGVTREEFQENPIAAAFVGLWADRPAAGDVEDGSLLIATDVGLHGYAQFFSDGTFWRPVNGHLLLSSLVQDVAGISQVGEQLLKRLIVPAGLWCPGGTMRITAAFDKTSNDTGSCKVRIGGTDVSAITFGTTIVGAAVILESRAVGDTSVRRTGSNTITSALPLGNTTANARPAAIAVPSLQANPINIDAVFTLDVVAGGSIPTLQDFVVEYLG